MKSYRQGDVLIIPVKTISKTGNKAEDRCVLAFGEATGHAHEIKELTKVEAFVGSDGTTVSEMEVKEAVDLVHQEHDAIRLEPGKYKVIRQVEESTDWEGLRRVAD